MRPITYLAPALLVTGAIAGCATTPAEQARADAATATIQHKLDVRLAGLVAGPSTDCINNYPEVHSEAYGSKIVYTVSSRLVYVNETTGGCENMARGDYLVTVSNGGRLCRGDVGRTITPNVDVPSGSCALGSFTPFTR